MSYEQDVDFYSSPQRKVEYPIVHIPQLHDEMFDQIAHYTDEYYDSFAAVTTPIQFCTVIISGLLPLAVYTLIGVEMMQDRPIYVFYNSEHEMYAFIAYVERKEEWEWRIV